MLRVSTCGIGRFFPARLGAGVASVSLGSVSFRTYCETDIDPSHRKYSQLQAAIRYLQGKEPDLECKADPAGRRPPAPSRQINTFTALLIGSLDQTPEVLTAAVSSLPAAGTCGCHLVPLTGPCFVVQATSCCCSSCCLTPW